MTEKQPPPAEGAPDQAILEELLSRLQGGEFARWIDLISALLLSVAVVASAFSAWQATLWGGVQATSYAEASSARLQSNRELAIGLTRLDIDVITFIDAAIASAQGDQEVVDLFEERLFRDQFKPILDEWLELDPVNNADAPATPFGIEGVIDTYFVESFALEETANEKFEEGKEANQNGDDYILATVLFASVLFFAGVTTKFKSPRVRSLSLAIATTVLVVGAVWLFSLPRLDVFF
jgi:hypothetical protein